MKVLNLKAKPDFPSKISGIEKDDGMFFAKNKPKFALFL